MNTTTRIEIAAALREAANRLEKMDETIKTLRTHVKYLEKTLRIFADDTDDCVSPGMKSIAEKALVGVIDNHSLYWENRYHELMAERGWTEPSDSEPCFKASQEVEAIIKHEKEKAA